MTEPVHVKKDLQGQYRKSKKNASGGGGDGSQNTHLGHSYGTIMVC